MTKKTILTVLLIILTACASSLLISAKDDDKRITVNLYLPDIYQLQLVHVEDTIAESSKTNMARELVKKLTANYNYNSMAKIFPKVDGGVSVKVKGKIAIINFTNDFVTAHSGGSTGELLTVYSLVDTITQIKGIEAVRFTIDGKKTDTFKGYLDMSELFYFSAV